MNFYEQVACSVKPRMRLWMGLIRQYYLKILIYIYVCIYFFSWYIYILDIYMYSLLFLFHFLNYYYCHHYYFLLISHPSLLLTEIFFPVPISVWSNFSNHWDYWSGIHLKWGDHITVNFVNRLSRSQKQLAMLEELCNFWRDAFLFFFSISWIYM